ncbi:PAS domain S-box protein [Pedobacter soli]|uniref:histidine kinase n=1 Tax=Pedobacter soli TaxID=390242 RepID=A0A1G6S8H1_9SPHI|nr:PAS domain S-box protein [Pedobacter soli]SDD13023.1 PAS domain S-box-containing protein [Pedobacter soli]
MITSNDIAEVINELEKLALNLNLDEDKLQRLNAVLKIAEEKNAILHAINQSTDDAIISKNLDGIITSWNKAASRIFGYTAEEMIGVSILTLIPEDLHYEETEIIAKLQRGIAINHFETKRRRKDGTLVDLSLTISPVLNSKGVIIGVSKIARDITDRLSAEVNSKRLSAIIESSDDAIISKDLNSIVTSWNDSAVRIFGYNAEEMIGQSILKIIPNDRHDEEPKILSQLSQGIRVDHFETIRRRKDGRLIDVSLTISPIKDSAGRVIGLSKIARDITERKQADKKKEEFIGLVSHELKTPLTSLRSYVQVALFKARKEENDFIDKALSRAELQTKKMEAMIRDFLNISRMEDGHLKLNLSQFDLSALINNCISDASITTSKHHFNYIGEQNALAIGDAEKISLVLINLISNAIKYSPDGGEITVTCERQDNYLTVAVKDQGIGIPKEDQKLLFRKFYRIQSEETRSISGFGIGLYLVYAILELHGSSIEVESTAGSGSTFLFKLKTAD